MCVFVVFLCYFFLKQIIVLIVEMETLIYAYTCRRLYTLICIRAVNVPKVPDIAETGLNYITRDGYASLPTRANVCVCVCARAIGFEFCEHF